MLNNNVQENFRLINGAYLLHIATIASIIAPVFLIKWLGLVYGGDGLMAMFVALPFYGIAFVCAVFANIISFFAKKTRVYIVSACSILLFSLVCVDLTSNFKLNEVQYEVGLHNSIHWVFSIYIGVTIVFFSYELWKRYKNKISLFKWATCQK